MVHIAEASAFVHNLESKILATNTNPTLPQFNVGTGADVTIRELAEIVTLAVAFIGKLVFDKTKAYGTPRKLFDVCLLSNLGWNSTMLIKTGLEQSHADFKSNL